MSELLAARTKALDKYLATLPLAEDVDIYSMKTKVLEMMMQQETGGAALFKKVFYEFWFALWPKNPSTCRF